MNPTGGLPRRKSAMKELQAKGPTLSLDSGNALFGLEGKVDEEPRPRAKFILEAMGQLGTRAMAAGAKDLGAGATWLKQAAASSGVKILSANLRENGNKLFDSSTVIAAGGVRVGLIGLSPVGVIGGQTQMVGDPLVPLVKTELAKLKGQADLIVLLAAVSQADAFELAKEFKSQVDFVIRSGEGGGMIPPQRNEGAWVVSSGFKGQALAQLGVKVDGKGAFIDLSEIAREKELLASLDLKLKDFEPRVKAATDPQSKALMQQTMTELQQRRAEQKKKVDVGVAKDARTFDFAFTTLDAKVADEPGLKAEVLKYEPTYAGSH
jgi:2',3'-cyclic-nucleotide 2'-phosphodiesterase (5'-nucleotidase family)